MFVEYSKRSKKAKKEYDKMQRVVWGFNPATRTAPDKKKYNRKRAKADKSIYDYD